MSFMKNFFGGKGKKKEEKEEGKSVRFRSDDSSSDQGRRQSIAFADRTFGEENLSEYARSKGTRRARAAQSLPGVNSDDTRMEGKGRGNRSVITANHERYHIDYSPEGPSFHMKRGQRRKREYRSEIDLSFSDQENHNETRRRDEANYVAREINKYRQQRNTAREENRRLRDENERLKVEREEMKSHMSHMKKELDRLKTAQTTYPSFAAPLPPSFSSHHNSFHHNGTDSYSSRATSLASSSTFNDDTAGEYLQTTSPIQSPYFSTHRVPYT